MTRSSKQSSELFVQNGTVAARAKEGYFSHAAGLSFRNEAELAQGSNGENGHDVGL